MSWRWFDAQTPEARKELVNATFPPDYVFASRVSNSNDLMNLQRWEWIENLYSCPDVRPLYGEENSKARPPSKSERKFARLRARWANRALKTYLGSRRSGQGGVG